MNGYNDNTSITYHTYLYIHFCINSDKDSNAPLYCSLSLLGLHLHYALDLYLLHEYLGPDWYDEKYLITIYKCNI